MTGRAPPAGRGEAPGPARAAGKLHRTTNPEASADRPSPGAKPNAPRPGQISALLQALAGAPEGEEWHTEPQPGDRLGDRFRLVRLLGRGGFGAVFEAVDERLGRPVAVKAVRTGARAALRQQRLQEEAEAAARLSHPNIVTLHDLGSFHGGPYLVLELLRGESLGARLERGALPPGEALRIATEVARALAHAHERGVIHRDLKPLNVFLCDGGAVKLLDFGLAHAFGHRIASGGTPAYMPPEQRSGAPEDERTDVFALGAMLHEMLSGRRAFDGSASPARVRPPPRLEVEGMPGLGELVERMVAIDPVRRPRDGGEALEALLALVPPSAIPPAPGPVRTRRKPRLVARVAVSLAVLVLVPLLAYAAWRLLRAPRPASPVAGPTIALADVANETGDPELDGISGLLLTAVEQSRYLRVLPRRLLLDLLHAAELQVPARIDERHGVRAARRAKADALLVSRIVRLDDLYVVEVRGVDPVSDRSRFSFTDQERGKGNLLRLLDRVAESVRLALGEPPNSIRTRGVATGALTSSLDAWRRYEQGMACFERRSFAGTFRRCLEDLQAAVTVDPGFALAHLQISFLHFLQGSPRALQKEALARALQHAERIPPSDVFRLRGMTAFLEGRDSEAKEHLRQAAEAAPDDKYAWWFAAEVAYHRDEFAEALPFLRKVYELDPAWLSALRHLAAALGVASDRERLAALAADLERRGDHADALLGLCSVRLWISPSRAVEACERARAAGAAAEVDPLLAIALLAHGDRALLEAHLARMAASAEGTSFGWYMSLWLRGQEGRWAEVREVVARLGNPDDSWFHSQLAELYAGSGDVERTWRAALRILELDRALVTNVAVHLAYLGDLSRAAEFAPYLPPASPRVKAYHAVVRWRQGDLPGAIDLLREVASTAPLSADPAIPPPLYLLGEALAEAGRDAEAVDALRRFVQMPTTYPTWFKPRARFHLARCLERMGEREAARGEVAALLRMWAHADPRQPQLADARALGVRLGIR